MEDDQRKNTNVHSRKGKSGQHKRYYKGRRPKPRGKRQKKTALVNLSKNLGEPVLFKKDESFSLGWAESQISESAMKETQLVLNSTKLLSVLPLPSTDLPTREMSIMSEQRIERIKKSINAVPDFPKPGILFRDIFPLFQDASVITDTIFLMVEHVREKFGSVDVIVGLDARGFLFGPMMAVQLGCAFVPIRKKGKLPGKCVHASYTLEYGDDAVEAQVGAITKGQRVVIVDDLIATGGTLRAASDLVTQMSGTILECLVLIELLDLKGSATLIYPFHSVLKY